MTETAPEYLDADYRYRNEGRLGKGSFGEVYRVFDERRRQYVALKMTEGTSAREQQWIKKEWRVQQKFNHPDLSAPIELHQEGDRCFFTMPLVAGGQPFDEHLRIGDVTTEPELQSAIRRVCAAAYHLADQLCAVHREGECHGDVKPDNVLVTPDDHVHLIDFGLNRPLSGARDTDTVRRAFQGTPLFAAPEQFMGAEPSVASDWYSAGVLLYLTLTRQFPFERDVPSWHEAKRQAAVPPSTLLPGLPETLDALLLEMLDPEPERRPDGREIRLRLARIAGIEPGESLRERREVEADDGLPGREILVAREEELAELAEAYAETAGGRPALVEVVGESGIGKTALVRHFVEELAGAAAPPLVLTARCHRLEIIPFKAVDAIIDDITRYWVTRSVEDAPTLRPVQGLEELMQLFPQLDRVRGNLGMPPPSRERRGDPRTVRETGFDALKDVIGRLRNPGRPVVLWIDDVQWADDDSLDLLARVFGGGAPPVVLLVLSRHVVSQAEHPELLRTLRLLGSRMAHRRIDLEALSDERAADLVRSVLADASLRPEVVRAVVTEAGGEPYLLREFAFFAARRFADALPSAGQVGGSEAALMQARLAELDADDRELLKLAVIADAPLPEPVLRASAGSPPHHRVTDLIRQRLLRYTPSSESGGGTELVQVYHDRLKRFVETAWYDEIEPRHHLSLLVEMERGLPQASGAHGDAEDSEALLQATERLLVHAEGAGERERAARYAARAARGAARKLRFERAVALYRKALEYTGEDEPRAALHAGLGEALADCGRSTESAKEFDNAFAALALERPDDAEQRAYLRRRTGEQFLKGGHFRTGEHLLSAFLADSGFRLPTTGEMALFTSSIRRVLLYLRLAFRPYLPRKVGDVRDVERERAHEARLSGLWGATTALSMTDPIRSDSVGLLHFHEALSARHHNHIVRSYQYEAAFAALFAYFGLTARARRLLDLSAQALEEESDPYLEGFQDLAAGIGEFFASEWGKAVERLDRCANHFRANCKEAEYEAAVAIVFKLQALGQAGDVKALVAQIPEAIEEANARRDLFAVNNYRGGFHAIGRIAAGQLETLEADLAEVDRYLKRAGEEVEDLAGDRFDIGGKSEPGADSEPETAKPRPRSHFALGSSGGGVIGGEKKRGFYLMHAYHRVFARVSAYLYRGEPRAALALIDADWGDLQGGLFLFMQLPAMELRWTRARACLGAALEAEGREREQLLGRVRRLTWWIRAFGTSTAGGAHAALLRAGVAAVRGHERELLHELRTALVAYEKAHMAVQREVARWCLGRLVGGREGAEMLRRVEEDWRQPEGVGPMEPLVSAIAPGVDRALGLR